MKMYFAQMHTKGELLKHSPKYLFKHCIKANYVPGAKCEKFLEYLEFITSGDEELKALIQVAVGYILSHYNNAKTAFLLYGIPHTGKSVLCKILENIVGADYVAHIDMKFLHRQEYAASLSGKILNVALDLDKTVLKEVGFFKSLTSHDDTLGARLLYANVGDVKGETKMLFSTNHLLSFDTSLDFNDIEAVFNRLIYVEGNTFRSVADMMRTTNLFEPFPDSFNNDSAFFDRIHAYLPGWETPKLKSSLFTNNYGLISDCFSEFCHAMRIYDFTNLFGEYFALNDSYNTRDDIAVRRTFSGLAKLVYPAENMTKEEAKELLEYSIECRRRVKEQLRKMNPAEFSDVGLGYIDMDTGEEFIVDLPEVSEGSLIFDGFEKPGYVYAVGKSVDNKVGIYRLENKLINGTGTLSFKNVEGLSKAPKTVRDSITAAFNYFEDSARKLVSNNYADYDYSLYFNDLQNRNVSDEVSVAEVVGLFSALANKSVLPATVICGRVVMSGTMMPIQTEIEEIFVAAANAGAKRIFMPEDSREKCVVLRSDLKNEIEIVFYRNPLDAAKKALGIK